MKNLFQVDTTVEHELWNSTVDILNGLCFHLYEWSLYAAKKNESKILYFRLTGDDGEPLALAFGRLRTKKIAGISINHKLSFSCLPASRDQSALKCMLDRILSYCHQQKIISIEISSFGTPVWTDLLGDFGFSVKKRWEFFLDIDMSEDELWTKIGSDKRRMVRRAKKAGFEVERVEKIQQIMQFRDLAFETQKRKKEQGVLLPVGDKDDYVTLKTKLMDLGIGRLYLAYDGEEPVAGIFLVGYRHFACYMLTSANEKGIKKSATDLLLWTAMKEYLNEGYKIFSVGGLSEGDLAGQPLEKAGLYRYKKQFGTDVYACYKGVKVLRPNRLRLFSFAKKIKAAVFK